MEKTISVSYSIMAHPSRKEFIPELQKALHAPVIWDRGLGIWDTCKRSWREHDKNADIHFVIQDDAILCENFKERVLQFVSQFKDEYAYQLYYAEKIRNIKKFNSSLENGYMIRERMPHGISIGMPTFLIDEMIDFCDYLEDIPQDDVRIKKFLMSVGVQTVLPIPSLVDHRTCESLVGGKKGRVAHYFIDNEFHGLTSDNLYQLKTNIKKELNIKKTSTTRKFNISKRNIINK